MNILFVCSKNQWRSPTAERVFGNHASYPNICTRSAGTSAKAAHTVTAQDIAWADKVFVMEQKHKTILKQRFTQALNSRAMIVLDIPDDYHYMDDELVQWLLDSVPVHFDLA